MTPVLSAVYNELLERANSTPHKEKARSWVYAFVERTGSFVADHPCTPYRLAAAWEDALCRGGLASALLGQLHDHAERTIAQLLTRAHRGVFRFETEAQHHLVHDLLSGASFMLVARDDIGREVAGDNLGGMCQGRVVAAADGCAMLPGVVFHAPEATAQIVAVVRHGLKLNMASDEVLDALLRMDHSFRTMSRVRPQFAYRVQALGPLAPSQQESVKNPKTE